MAPSSRDASSFLNSTSGLLSVLDLNQEHKQDMEEMDVDQIVYVPDTPDRISARHIRGAECVEEESKLPVASNSGNHQLLDEGALNRPRGRTRPVTENGHSRRLHFHAPENLSSLDKAERHISFNVSSSENSFAPRTALFRGMRADTISKHDTRHSIGAQRLDKGKALCTKFPIKSSTCQENSAALDMKQNGLMQISEKVFSRGASEDIVTEEIRRGPIATNGHSSLHCIANSPMIPGNICKGKEKKGDTCNGAGFGRDCGRVIDLSSGSQPRPGKKRLVRNGCISPHNIAMSLSSEHNNIGSIDVECTGTTNVGSSCPPREIGVGNSIAEDNNRNEVKGKHPCYPCSPREHDARTKHSSGRSSILHGKGVNGSVALGSNEGLDGWVSTRNRLKNSSSGETCSHSRRNDGDGCYQQHEIKRNNRIANNNRTASNNRTDGLNLEVQDGLPSGQASPNLVSESDQVDVRHQVADKFIKRQKNRSSTVSDHGECSTSRFSESEILFLDSPGIPLNSGSTNNQIRRRRGNLDPVIEIDESSPEVGRHHSLGCISNDNSDVRAMQVEADEILARELQEQLYQEMPAVEAGEIDEHMAWALQQQEGTQHASSSGIHHMLHPRGSSISPVYRQSRSRSSQNPPRRRGTQARAPPSSRMTQLRRRFPGQPRTLLSRERNLQFPLDMDLDMRIDMLEALEATFGDFSDLAGHGLQLQRDFNENDYEMLLALDENNHQHVGASVNQINNLPESTIQTDNFEEVCAVCLETPARGDTIRHLPCFHKFHKDCIDPWLTRKRSCPVCKSSIT